MCKDYVLTTRRISYWCREAANHLLPLNPYCSNVVVDVFAHIGDVTWKLTDNVDGNGDLQTVSEGVRMLKVFLEVLPEVRASTQQLE